MNKMNHFFKIVIVTLVLGLNMSQVAFAGDSDNSSSAIGALLTYIQEVVTATVDMISKSRYEFNPSLPDTITNNIGKSFASKQTADETQQLTRDQIKDLLTGKNTSLTQDLADIKASDSFTPNLSKLPWAGFGNKGIPSVDFSEGNANFDPNSLIGIDAYNDDQKVQAQNYIRFVTEANQPLTTLNLTNEDKQKLQGKGAYDDYLVTLRSLTAKQMLATNNLYYLMAERTVQKGLGTDAGLHDSTGKEIPDASPLQIQQYAATRRTSSEEWYRDMAKASPETVSRESLFVQAEMLRQMYENQKTMERLLAILSVMELQAAPLEKMQLQQKENLIKNMLGKNNVGGETATIVTP